MQAEPRPESGFEGVTGTAILLLGYSVILCLTGLSLWAVGAVQLASRPETDPLRFWYLLVFLALELWVCAGLVVIGIRLRQGRWGAALIALMLWLAALGLSAMQEKRFHTLFDGKLDAAVAQKLTKRANAEARIAELEGTLKAFNKPSRSVEAIEAELSGYEARSDAENFPTRITSLKAELKAAQSYAVVAADLGAQRNILEDTAALAAERLDARKVGQDFRLFGKAVPADASIWLLIATMLAIKSLGPWLLIGNRDRVEEAPEPAQPAQDPDWVYVERTDRQGRVRRVKVARADAA